LELDLFPFRRESISVLTRILAIEPRDANAAWLLGDLLYYRSRRSEAQAAWRQAIEADPRHFSALRDLGMSLLEAGRAADALSLLLRAAAERPDHLQTTLLVAQLQLRAGNLAAAREALEQALRKRPGDDRLLERLATIEAAGGAHQRALDLLTKHVFEPKHQAYSLLHLFQSAQLMIAIDRSRAGDAAGAIDRVRAAQAPPASLGVDDFAVLQSSRLLVFEALLQQAAGNRAAARRAWASAAATVHEAHDEEGLFRAHALLKEGRSDNTQAWFREFAKINARNLKSDRALLRAQARYLAGVHAAFQGRTAAARANFNQCLEIDRSHLWARQALAWLAWIERGLWQTNSKASR
jgi:tetratricopeptide (TPR) repeat protein